MAGEFKADVGARDRSYALMDVSLAGFKQYPSSGVDGERGSALIGHSFSAAGYIGHDPTVRVKTGGRTLRSWGQAPGSNVPA